MEKGEGPNQRPFSHSLHNSQVARLVLVMLRLPVPTPGSSLLCKPRCYDTGL